MLGDGVGSLELLLPQSVVCSAATPGPPPAPRSSAVSGRMPRRYFQPCTASAKSAARGRRQLPCDNGRAAARPPKLLTPRGEEYDGPVPEGRRPGSQSITASSHQGPDSSIIFF